ncbi:MAG: ribosome biogenesis GTPase Der [Gemmatimonadetes bacterium]|nr:MAG: ribosome biogenesis GTPase Der [Gemmatimonadota bacterium]
MPYIPTVAIIGQPNVGKSTLFNRIVGKQIAITDDMPGVTRDRNYALSEWTGHPFMLVDTGGLVPDPEGAIELAIKEQALIAFEEADVIIFLVDGRAPINREVEDISHLFHKTEKPFLLVANKMDGEKHEYDMYEYVKLGFGEPFPISAAHGRNVGDLLDEVVARFPAQHTTATDIADNSIKLAVVGRPNVGKSSIVNAILGYDKTIVTPVAGTTRDSIDSKFKRNGQEFTIIDTAGMRKKSRVLQASGVEYFSNVRTIKSIHQSDVVLCLLNAEEGVVQQDHKILSYVRENYKNLILVVNKWDLVEKDHRSMNIFRKNIREKLNFVDYAPIIFTSARTKRRVFNVIDKAVEVYQESQRRIPTAELNKVVEQAIAYQPPPSVGRRFCKFYYTTQVRVAPPTFVFFVSRPDLIQESYKRYLYNQLRRAFRFEGVPLKLIFRGKTPPK